MNRRDQILSILHRENLVQDPQWISQDATHIQISCQWAKWLHPKKRDSHPSMSINLEKGTYNCFTCREYGKIWELLAYTGKMSSGYDLLILFDETLESKLQNISDSYDIDNTIKEYNMEPLLKWYNTLDENKPAIRDYLNSRDWDLDSDRIIDPWNMKWNEQEGRVCFTLYDGDKFIGIGGRQVDDLDPVYKYYWNTKTTRSFMNTEKCTARYILIVEGPFDFFNIWCIIKDLKWEQYFHLVCSFSAKCSDWHFDQLEIWQKPVVCFYDHGEEAAIGYSKMKKALEDRIPRLLRVLPPKDKDPGEMVTPELETVLSTLIV